MGRVDPTVYAAGLGLLGISAPERMAGPAEGDETESSRSGREHSHEGESMMRTGVLRNLEEIQEDGRRLARLSARHVTLWRRWCGPASSSPSLRKSRHKAPLAIAPA